MSSDDDKQKAGLLKQIEGYRRQIDKLDEDLIEALGERMKIIPKIGELKSKANLDVEDKDREGEVKRNWRRVAGRKNLSWEFVGEILRLVLSHSKTLE